MSKSTITHRLTKPVKAKDAAYAVIITVLGVLATINTYNGVTEYIATH